MNILTERRCSIETLLQGCGAARDAWVMKGYGILRLLY